MDEAYEAYDFTQCKRSDGTIYGTRGEKCLQKGAKEVSKSEGGTGLFGPTGKDNAKKASSGQLKINKLGSQATIDLISEAAKMEGVRPQDKAKVIKMGYDHLSELAKGEGKKPPTLTSIVSGSTLKKLGIDPDKQNVKSGSRTTAAQRKAAEDKAKADIKAAAEKAEADKKLAARARNNPTPAQLDKQLKAANEANQAAYKRVEEAREKVPRSAWAKDRAPQEAVVDKLTKAWEKTKREAAILRKMKKEGIDRPTAEASYEKGVTAQQAKLDKAQRQRENNARGRMNRRLIEANRGNRWEDVRDGRR